MSYIMKLIDKEHFIDTCVRSKTMAQAARELGMHFNTFKKYAIKFGCYNPNQSGKGVTNEYSRAIIATSDILNGKFPNYETYKLKKRLIKEGYKEDRCEICGWSCKRSGENLSTCELHHINGDSHDHRLENLIILCPNCHSLTDNFRAKKRCIR